MIKRRFKYFKDLKFHFLPAVTKQHLDFTKVYLPYTTVYWKLIVESKDFDSAEFMNELNRSDIWQSWLPNSHSLRSKYVNGKSEMFDNLIDMIGQIKREELIQQCIDSNPYLFNYYWMRGSEFYLKKAFINTQILKDEPGFFMDPHKDNNEIIGQYIVNLIDNGNATTNFFNLNPNTLLYKASGERKQGVGFLNTAVSNHNIENVDKTRYVLYFNILQDVYCADRPVYTIDLDE